MYYNNQYRPEEGKARDALQDSLQNYEGYGPVKTLPESEDHRTSKQIKLQEAVNHPGWKKLTIDEKMEVIDHIMDGKSASETGSDEVTLEDLPDTDKVGDVDPTPQQ